MKSQRGVYRRGNYLALSNYRGGTRRHSPDGLPARVLLRVSYNWSGQKHTPRRQNGPYSEGKSTRLDAVYFS